MCAIGARSMPERPGDALIKIYTLLRTRTGHDFSEYKDRTFLRRVQRRMQVAPDDKARGLRRAAAKRARRGQRVIS